MMRQRDTELSDENRDTEEHTERHTIYDKKALQSREGSFLHLLRGSSQLT